MEIDRKKEKEGKGEKGTEKGTATFIQGHIPFTIYFNYISTYFNRISLNFLKYVNRRRI